MIKMQRWKKVTIACALGVLILPYLSLVAAGRPSWAKPGAVFIYSWSLDEWYEEDLSVLMQRINETVSGVFAGMFYPKQVVAFVFRLVSANETHGVFRVEAGSQSVEGYVAWSDMVLRVGGEEFLPIFRPLEKLSGLPQTAVFGLPVYEVVERVVENGANVTRRFYYHRDTGVLVLSMYVRVGKLGKEWSGEVGYIALMGSDVVRSKPQWAAPGVKLVYRTYELNATDREEALRRAEEEFTRGAAAGEEYVVELAAVGDLNATVKYPSGVDYLYWLHGGWLYQPPETLQSRPLVRLGPYETYKVVTMQYGREVVAYYQKDTGILLMAVSFAEVEGRLRAFVFSLASTNISIPMAPLFTQPPATPPPAVAGPPGGLWLVVAVAVAAVVVAAVILLNKKKKKQ
jgi:hypothetical protein